MNPVPSQEATAEFDAIDLENLRTFPDFFSTDGSRWYMSAEGPAILCVRAAAEIERLRAAFRPPTVPDQQTEREPWAILRDTLAALERCRDDMEGWAGYASDYFKEKHRFDEDVAAANLAIEAAKACFADQQTEREAFAVDEDGNPYTPERLAAWLDAKYSRHLEIEDKHAADYIRRAACFACSELARDAEAPAAINEGPVE